MKSRNSKPTTMYVTIEATADSTEAKLKATQMADTLKTSLEADGWKNVSVSKPQAQEGA